MPIRTQCPSCQTVLSAPDGSRQRVRCPQCMTIFTLADSIPEVTLARPPEKEMLQSARDYKPGTPRRAAPSIRPKGEADVGRKSSGVSVGLLVGIGVVAGGFLILLVGGGVAAWLFFSSPSNNTATSVVATAPPMEAIAEIKPAMPVPEPARQAAPVQAVPDAPAVAAADEEFVDIPERGEDMPGVAGLKPDQPPGGGAAPGMPGVRPRVALTNGRAGRVPGRTGMAFQVDYRFEQGGPAAGALRYKWVIRTASGQAYQQTLNVATLGGSGTLSGRVLGAAWAQGPYQTYLAVEIFVPGRLGPQEEKISDVLTIR